MNFDVRCKFAYWMKIAIVKYNAGNILSVTHALRRLGIEPEVTDDPESLRTADKVIFPGVGEAGSAMDYLVRKNLDKIIPALRMPFLGICLGLQVMCRHSEENNTPGLGIFDLEVRKFPASGKVPHIGWNQVMISGHPLFKNISGNPFLYFVHSYYAEIGSDTIATSEYLVPFSSAFNKKNFYAIQAHPEKSGDSGEQILANFVNI